MCTESIPTYLKITILYEAYNKTKKTQIFENAMLNSTFQGSQLFLFFDHNARQYYLQSVRLFIHNLVQISHSLKNMPTEIRNVQLKKFLIKANRSLDQFRINNSDNLYCQGIHLPFDDSSSNLIVRVLETECCVFQTKKRVPYKLLFETIDINELQSKIPKPSKIRFHQISTENPRVLEDFLQSDFHDNFANQQLIRYQKKKFDHQYPPQKRRGSCPGKFQSKLKGVLNKKLQPTIPEIDRSKLFKYKQNATIKEKYEFVKWLHQQYKLPYLEQLLETLEKKRNQEVEIQEKKKNPFEKKWVKIENEIRNESPYGNFSSYRLRCFIVKGGDDLRQEMIMMQVIKKIKDLFEQEKCKAWVETYEIMVFSNDSGMVEFCKDSISIDGLKKQFPQIKGLQQIFQHLFSNYEEARQNFIKSLAGYSLLQYLFAIKDRHNGNILINSQGYMIHIDFGFILGLSPGGINCESCPFKLTKEYIELLGGGNSQEFEYFKQLLQQGMKILSKNYEEFMRIFSLGGDLKCFEKMKVDKLKERFHEGKDMEAVIERLVQESYENKKTAFYDSYQKLTNGIMI